MPDGSAQVKSPVRANPLITSNTHDFTHGPSRLVDEKPHLSAPVGVLRLLRSMADKPVKDVIMLPTFTMRQLLEAGVHFGHQSHRWNPKMSPYIFGTRNNIHVVDLTQTMPLLHQALVKVSDTVAKGGRVLFVGTKRQASDSIADAAKRCAQYYINHRWLGGTLTNWKTISLSIRRLRQLEEILDGSGHGRTKKELLNLTREREKLDKALGGIKEMGGTPDLLFVIDSNKEGIAIAEAKKLNIPIVSILDTNCNPDGIDLPVPGNDDAGRAITLYCDLIARAAIDGIERAAVASGVDTGAAVEPIAEVLPEGGATAEAVTFEGIEAPRGEADELKVIAGLTDKLAVQLNAIGVYHYWQIADLDEANATLLDAALKLEGGATSKDWVEPAKKLVAAAAA